MRFLALRYTPIRKALSSPFTDLLSIGDYALLVVQDGAAPKANAGNAFEDVLYGSDSDSEEDHGDNEVPRTAAKQKGSGGNGRPIAGGQKAARRGDKSSPANRSETRIRADDEDPMDLLHAGAANAVGG
jgi:hypothetical protein